MATKFNWIINMLPNGIISVLQIPFSSDGLIDYQSLNNLIEYSIKNKVDGFLVPAVASEVQYLTDSERSELLHFVNQTVSSRVPIIAGASNDDLRKSIEWIKTAKKLDLSSCVISIPERLYGQDTLILSHIMEIVSETKFPIIVQDLDWKGSGISLDLCKKLYQNEYIVGFKIETMNAGEKYTQIKEKLGKNCWVSGGWAVPQLIEALDRGVDAMIPESSMVPFYKKITDEYVIDRAQACELFRSLQPVLCFSNQNIQTSVLFFKMLLQDMGIFETCYCRIPVEFDSYQSQIANDMIRYYRAL